MFVIILTYKKQLACIDEHISEHKAFLEKYYNQNCFIVSGRKNPRTGGVIISQLEDRDLVEKIIREDPFYINDLADYELIEFIPGMYDARFKEFL